jgi:peptidoglycan/LPS O-acetylase OafA/YrhL
MLVAAVLLEIATRSRFDALGPLNDLWLGPFFALLLSRIATGDLRILGRFFSSRPMVWLGASSYSLYLIHAFVLEMVWRWIVRPLHQPPLEALALELGLGVVASVAAARVFYLLVERRFLGTSAPNVELAATAKEVSPRRLARASRFGGSAPAAPVGESSGGANVAGQMQPPDVVTSA